MNIPEQNKDTPTPDPIPPSDSSEPFPSVAQDPPFIPYRKPGANPSRVQMSMEPSTKLATASLILGAVSLGLFVVNIICSLSFSSYLLGQSSHFIYLNLSYPVLACGLLSLVFGMISKQKFQFYPPNFPGRRNSSIGMTLAIICFGIYAAVMVLLFILMAYLAFFFSWFITLL